MLSVPAGVTVSSLVPDHSHSLTYICLLEGWEGEGYCRNLPYGSGSRP